MVDEIAVAEQDDGGIGRQEWDGVDELLDAAVGADGAVVQDQRPLAEVEVVA